MLAGLAALPLVQSLAIDDLRPAFHNSRSPRFGLFGIREMQDIAALAPGGQLIEGFGQFSVFVQRGL